MLPNEIDHGIVTMNAESMTGSVGKLKKIFHDRLTGRTDGVLDGVIASGRDALHHRGGG
jgi:hypothetical protein